MDINEGEKHNADFHISDILIEVLEVAINLILYVRNIYPDGIFQRCQKYNIGVMMSTHPKVNEYIKDLLETIRPYISKGEVEKIVVQITNNNGDPVERFCFEMQISSSDSKQCHFDMETHLRALLLKLNTCEAMLKPLPKDCSFQVLAYTKQSVLKNMEEKSDFQNFPWIVTENKCRSSSDDNIIIPIRSCATEVFVLQCYVEERQHKLDV